MLETGATLPAVTLADDSGSELSTHDLLGKHLILYFYPKDDTPGCTNEATQFADSVETFAGKDAQIVGVSRDSVASHREFKAKYGIPFRLLADVDSVLYDACSVGVARCTFLFDPVGKLVKVWPKVRVAGHAEDVLSEL